MRTKIILSMLTAAFVSMCAVNNGNPFEVNSTEANALLQQEKAIVVLDVRTPGEFSGGHIPGAVNMDMSQPGMLDSINRLDKNEKYLVYCRTKNRSGIVVNNMKENGFQQVYQMTDGMVGWNRNGLPVVLE